MRVIAMTLPNFLIIGAMKAGTTALYHYLKQHPQIYMSPVKETNFFLRDHKNIEEYSTFFSGVSNEKVIGEASPGYLASAKAYKRIAYYLPEAKLIAILRNPVDRAYSHFLMYYRHQLSSMNEQEVLDYFIHMLQKDPLIIQGGLYYTYLKHYLNLFDREQIKICFYDDLKSTPDSLIKDIFQFLDVEENYPIENYNVYYNKGGIPKNKLIYISTKKIKQYFNIYFQAFISEEINKKIYSIYNSIKNNNLAKAPSLTPKIRQQLIQAYHEDILSLQALLQRDLSAWLN